MLKYNLKYRVFKENEGNQRMMKQELHNREMHIGGKFLSVQADPINDPIKSEENTGG